MPRVPGAVLVFGLVACLVGCSSSGSDGAPQGTPTGRIAVDFALMGEDLLTGTGKPNGSFTYLYSTLGNLERKDSVGQAADYATFEYDASGANVVQEKRYTQSDMLDLSIEYNYDTSGVLQEAVSYDANGVMTSYTTYVFSQGRKLSATVQPTTGTVHNYAFSYDASGNRTGFSDTVAGAVAGGSKWHYASDGAPASVDMLAADGTTVVSSETFTTVSSGSNYDYWLFWDF